VIKVSINKSIKVINQFLSNFYIFLLRFEVSQVRNLNIKSSTHGLTYLKNNYSWSFQYIKMVLKNDSIILANKIIQAIRVTDKRTGLDLQYGNFRNFFGSNSQEKRLLKFQIYLYFEAKNKELRRYQISNTKYDF